jgi:hypothetical protein
MQQIVVKSELSLIIINKTITESIATNIDSV